jgi:hydrogenase nickel incorporation protein HypA/HybF
MHEFSVARALLSQVSAQAETHGARCVRAVTVTVGEFSGVEAELLRTAFEQLSAGTIAAGAELRMIHVELIAECGGCGCEFAVSGFRFECPECAGRDVRILRGEELRLESLTMEATEPESCRST